MLPSRALMRANAVLLLMSTWIPRAGSAAFPVKASAEIPMGIYHLDRDDRSGGEIVDAVNLSIAEDGTFFWNICGCDFQFHQQGVWVKSGGELHLFELPDKELRWHSGLSISALVDSPLRVKKSLDSQGIVISGQERPVGGREPKPISQNWRIGRVCATCGGTPGPTGRQSCDLPLTVEEPCSRS